MVPFDFAVVENPCAVGLAVLFVVFDGDDWEVFAFVVGSYVVLVDMYFDDYSSS